MSFDHRPSVPETFTDLLPEDLINALQVGAAQVLGQPVTIVDPRSPERLKRTWQPCTTCPTADDAAPVKGPLDCPAQPEVAVSQLLASLTTREKDTVCAFRCRHGADFLVAAVRVDGLQALVTAGPNPSGGGPLPEEQFRREAMRIERIAQDYYEMRKAKVEAAIAQDVVLAVGSIATSSREELWEQCQDALEALRTGLKAEYVAFFAGTTESSLLLTFQAGVGALPPGVGRGGTLQFNWRKAGLDSEPDPDDSETGALPSLFLRWDQVDRRHQEQLARGLKGGGNPFGSTATLVPVRLPHGPFGLVVLGPRNSQSSFVDDPFQLRLCRDLGINLLTLYLSTILLSERDNWDKTSRMTGHRVRASIQALKSQLWAIRDHYAGRPNFTLEVRIKAEKGLNQTLKRLGDIALAAESPLPHAGDISVVSRQVVPLSLLIDEAVADQADFAADRGVFIEVSPQIEALPPVTVHPVLLRYVFINLINNGIKYSYPSLEEKRRVLHIKPARFTIEPLSKVRIEVVNFGLGIKRDDWNRIFTWGVRVAPENARHAGTYGRGIGLWEAKRIVEGHGGRLYVGSQHHSGEDVTDSNIQHCVTVFTVELPLRR